VSSTSARCNDGRSASASGGASIRIRTARGEVASARTSAADGSAVILISELAPVWAMTTPSCLRVVDPVPPHPTTRVAAAVAAAKKVERCGVCMRPVTHDRGERSTKIGL
jgi:hypothetical protein